MMAFCLFITVAIIGAIGCQGQHSTDMAGEQLHAKVRALELTVVKLLNKLDGMKVLQSVPVNSIQNAQKRTNTLPINPSDGFTLQSSLNDDEVGFSVSLVKDQFLEIGNKIVFDNVDENIKQAYNEATGEFVCPITGTYLFSMNLACTKDSYTEVSVRVKPVATRSRSILNAICDQQRRRIPNSYGLYCGLTQNGGTAIVRLNQGDRVFVNKNYPDDSSGIMGRGLTSFSGYLLRPS